MRMEILYRIRLISARIMKGFEVDYTKYEEKLKGKKNEEGRKDYDGLTKEVIGEANFHRRTHTLLN